MKVEQIYTLVNNATKNILGESAILSEDLSNVVDIGNAVFGSNNVDNYVKSLVDHIGKVIFVNRPYSASVPSVLMDKWEFGSVLEKIQADIPDAKENKDYELVDGTDYSPNVFYKPSVSAKFFNSKVTFEVDLSFTQKQVKESFSNAEQLNAFISMLYNSVEKSMSVKTDSLIMSTITNAMGETLFNEFPSVENGNYSAVDGVKAVNLLKRYNTEYGLSLTVEKAMKDPDFLRYSSSVIRKYTERLTRLSRVFNIGKKARFTPKDKMHIVFLSDFIINMETYLQSDVFHNELVKLPNGVETVPYWQGVKLADGKEYDDLAIGNIHLNIKDPSGQNATGVEINVANGIVLGCMFDNDALGVSNLERRVTTNYNPKAEFYNNFYKFESSYFNDLDENFVMFFIA